MVDRFRAAAGAADSGDVDAYVTGVWMVAALGAVLAVILFALYVVLALGLRRGSQAARIATWVVCGLGLLFGCGTTITVAVQRSGTGDPAALARRCRTRTRGWIALNVSLAVAQMLGYARGGDPAGGRPGWLLRAGYSFRVADPGRWRLCHIADLRLGEFVPAGSFPAVAAAGFAAAGRARTMTTGHVRPAEGCAVHHPLRADIDGRASPERVPLHP